MIELLVQIKHIKDFYWKPINTIEIGILHFKRFSTKLNNPLAEMQQLCLYLWSHLQIVIANID